VIASQVQQCFNVQDPLNVNRHYALKTDPRDLFKMGIQSDFEATGVNAADEINLVREDIPRTIIEKPANILQGIEDEDDEDSDFDDTLFDYMD